MEQEDILVRGKRYQLSLKNWLPVTFQIEKDLFYHMAMCLFFFGSGVSDKLFFSEHHIKFLIHFPINV